MEHNYYIQWRIQNSPEGGAPTPESAIIFQFFAKNCMKMKEFRSPGGCASLAPPLDPIMLYKDLNVSGL